MSDFDIKFGPWLNYGRKSIGEKMEELITDVKSPFNGCTIAQVFIYCMAYAFAKGKTPQKPPSEGGGSMPASAFNKEMRDFMKVIAVAHYENLDMVINPKKVVAIGEQYAFAGFKDIYDKISNQSKNIKDVQILKQILEDTIK